MKRLNATSLRIEKLLAIERDAVTGELPYISLFVHNFHCSTIENGIKAYDIQMRSTRGKFSFPIRQASKTA